MMDRLETTAYEPKCVVGGHMDRENTPRLRFRLETTYLAFSLRDVLARHLLCCFRAARFDEQPTGRVPSGRMQSFATWQWLAAMAPLLHLQELAGKAPSGSRAPMALDQNFQDVAVLVNRSPEIAALPTDRNQDLIHMPDIARPAMPPAQDSSKGRTEFVTPESDRLVGDGDAALGELVFDIPEAEGESRIEPHSVGNDLGWVAAPRYKDFTDPESPTNANLPIPSRWFARPNRASSAYSGLFSWSCGFVHPMRPEGLKLGVLSGPSASHLRVPASPSMRMASAASPDRRRFSGHSIGLFGRTGIALR